jgi:hypothetical protein
MNAGILERLVANLAEKEEHQHHISLSRERLNGRSSDENVQSLVRQSSSSSINQSSIHADKTKHPQVIISLHY